MKIVIPSLVFLAACASAPEPGSLEALKAEQRQTIARECIAALHEQEFRTRVEVVSHDPWRVCHAYAKQMVP